MLVKVSISLLILSVAFWYVLAGATNVPAIPSCDGGEVGFPAARSEQGGVVFYLSAKVMPFEGWEPIICSLDVGQMVQAMQPAREM